MRHLKLSNRVLGFTLLELIGVMAVMAILSAVLAPNVFSAIEEAYAEAEEQNLIALASSLKNSVVSNKLIPTATTASWVNAIADQSEFTVQSIEFNKKDFRRRLVFDPRFFTSSDSNFTGLTQNQGLANSPVSARAMLISDFNQHVPSITNSTSVFNDIWNQTSTATIKESKLIKITRINFSDFFHRVILSNAHTNQSFYQLEAGSQTSIPASSGGLDGVLNRYVLKGTKLGLFEQPFPAGALAQTLIVNKDMSLRYQNDGLVWHWVAQ